MISHVIEGDCLTTLRAMPDGCIDAVVSDPPYGLSKEPNAAEVVRHWCAAELRAAAVSRGCPADYALVLFPDDAYDHGGSGFMGKSWDSFVPGPEVWREVLRVLKPGGHALVFSGTRTYDLTVLAMRIAGFEIRDQLAWLYGTGFPKSLNVGSGIGTALKPAQEPIVLARKPIQGTVAANVLAHGTGGINVDACRIGSEPGGWGGGGSALYEGGLSRDGGEARPVAGRWPANVLLDETAAAMLDEQSGTSKDGVAVKRNGVRNDNPIAFASPLPPGTPDQGYGGSGGASRFFYVAKASKSEREAGLDHLPARTAGQLTDREDGSEGLNSPRAGAGRTSAGRRNHHPTVKPIELMRYLVKLITPPGGIVLDPYAGSGTTGIACVREGVSFVGCELSPEYCEIARARIKHAAV